MSEQEVKDTLSALRAACDERGIEWRKQDRKADLRAKLAAPLPGLGAPLEAAPAQEDMNGFLVLKVDDGNGNLDVQVRTVGNATLLEAPAVIGAALRQVKEHFGL